MPERLDLIALASTLSIAGYAFIVRLFDKWFGKKYDNIEALQNLLIKTNNGKDILDHLEEAKIRRLTAQQESEDIKVIIKAFPTIMVKLETMATTISEFQKQNAQNSDAMNNMAKAFNHMGDKFDEIKHGK